MTCATCDDTKVRPVYGGGTMSCPDCTPRRFAEAVPTGHGNGYVLSVGGEIIDGAYVTHVDMREELFETVDDINSAVEAREAKLSLRISNLRLAAAQVADAAEHLHQEARQMGYSTARLVRMGTAREELRRVLLDEVNDEPAHAVSGDVACGLAFDLGATQEKLEGRWAVLFDAMLEHGGEASELAWVLVDALGLAATFPRRNDIRAAIGRSLTDEQLCSECERRGLAVVRHGHPMTMSGFMEEIARQRTRMLENQPPPPLMVRVDPAQPGGDTTVMMTGAAARPDPDMPYESTGHVITRRTSLPEARWRRVNQGIPVRPMCQTCMDLPYLDGLGQPETCPTCGQRR